MEKAVAFFYVSRDIIELECIAGSASLILLSDQIVPDLPAVGSRLLKLGCRMSEVRIIIPEKIHYFRAVACRLQEDADCTPGF